MKQTASIIALLAIIFMMVTASATAQQYYHISELSAPDDGWNETYQTCRGDEIHVDTEIMIPNATSFPILQVGWYPPLSSQFVETYAAKDGQSKERWDGFIGEYGVSALYVDWDLALEKSEVKRGISWPSRELPLEGLDWKGAYAYQNPLPVNEAFAFITGVLQNVFMQYGEEYYDYELKRILLDDPPQYKGTPMREMGAYTFECYEVFHGIPFITNINGCFDNVIGSGCPSTEYRLRVISEDSYSFNAYYLRKEIACLVDDVPVIEFEQVKPVFEQLIIDGKVRDVYSVRLGYVGFQEEKDNTDIYRLAPCWVLECTYYSSAQDETEQQDAAQDYVELEHYKHIVVNAQTGALIDPSSTDSGRNLCPEIVTWEN